MVETNTLHNEGSLDHRSAAKLSQAHKSATSIAQIPYAKIDESEECKVIDTGARFLSPSSTRGNFAKSKDEFAVSYIQVGGDSVQH